MKIPGLCSDLPFPIYLKCSLNIPLAYFKTSSGHFVTVQEHQVLRHDDWIYYLWLSPTTKLQGHPPAYKRMHKNPGLSTVVRHLTSRLHHPLLCLLPSDATSHVHRKCAIACPAKKLSLVPTLRRHRGKCHEENKDPTLKDARSYHIQYRASTTNNPGYFVLKNPCPGPVL